MEMLYCIKCGTMENIASWQTLWHVIPKTSDEGVADIAMCNFDEGWATCPPPQFDMDVWMSLIEKETGDFDEYVHRAIREER